ncbi:nucleotidyltransferase family protein, partial [bacterium]|nr:nucleotidyltransferase family protein [bacterium]
MKVEKDYEGLLKLFNKHNVRYCIVGAFAVAFYAIPRYTKDIDILVEPNIENAQKILDALNEFGFRSLDLNLDDFSKANGIIQLGIEPIRIDLITSVGDLNFERIWKNRSKGNYGSETVNFIGLDELIKSKQIANRSQDQADLEILI